MQILGQYRSSHHRPVRLVKLCMKTLVSPGWGWGGVHLYSQRLGIRGIHKVCLHGVPYIEFQVAWGYLVRPVPKTIAN